MTTRLNIGLIGVGRMGRVYANDLAFRVPNARLTAVADQRADAAAAVAAECGVPKHYGSHHELLADKEIDAVVIITSTHTHGEMVIDAARSRNGLGSALHALSAGFELRFFRTNRRNGWGNLPANSG